MGPEKAGCVILLQISARCMILGSMVRLIHFLLALLTSSLRTRLSPQLEIAALRHQLSLYRARGRRPRIAPADRLLRSVVARLWSGWRRTLIFVQPRTVTTWQKRRFREYWRALSQSTRPGRPQIARDPCRQINGGEVPTPSRQTAVSHVADVSQSTCPRSRCYRFLSRTGLEWLARYCARPVFASERLSWAREGERLRYRLPKPRADGQTVFELTPFELLDRLAVLIPPPRRHRHRYHGVLAPVCPHRVQRPPARPRHGLRGTTPAQRP